MTDLKASQTFFPKRKVINMTKLFSLSMMFMLIFSAIVITPTSDALISPSNARIGDLVVFHQNFSTEYSVPDNVCMALENLPYVVKNQTLSYDYSRRAVTVTSVYQAVGKTLVGGLAAAVRTNITLDIGFSRENWNSYVYIYAANAWLCLQILDGSPDDTVKLISYYYYPTLMNKINNTVISGLQNDGRFKITIASDGQTRRNNIYLNDVWQFETPFSNTNELYDQTAINPFSKPYVEFRLAPTDAGGNAILHLYAITQTIPLYSLVTPIPNNKLIAFGLDGPHPYSTVKNGIALVNNNGGTGTIWADVNYINSYSDENLTAIKQLLKDGWELGIHYSVRLIDRTMENAIALMHSEYNQIEQLFGQAPTSWCSLENADNKSHADYAYTQLSMVWRNGYIGVRGLSNIGNLHDGTWQWWTNASAAGIAAPCFTHRTDEDPAIYYSISYSKFGNWVSNYRSHDMQICGYYHYWTIAQNTWHTSISDIEMVDGSMLSFTIDNIGGKSRLLIDADFVEIVLDEIGNEVDYEVTPDGVIIEVESGEYSMMTRSYHRINTVVSPLYAIIPMMAVMMIYVTILGLVKKM